jgi:hypothetical protein
VSSKNFFDRVLLSNDIPVTDMPPCLLTELMCGKDDAIKNYWIACTREQLRSIFMTIPETEAMPSMNSIAECSMVKLGEWLVSPVKSYVQSEAQGDISYAEQLQAVTIGVRTIDKYCSSLARLPRRIRRTFWFTVFQAEESLMLQNGYTCMLFPEALGYFLLLLWV